MTCVLVRINLPHWFITDHHHHVLFQGNPIIPVRTYSKNLVQRSISARKGTFLWKGSPFLKKGPKKFHPPPLFNLFSKCVASKNKALHIFYKRGQCSVVERNVCLEYALPFVNKMVKHTLKNVATNFERFLRCAWPFCGHQTL